MPSSPLRRLLAIVQLPPPIHGATVMNRALIQSEALKGVFEIDLLALQFAGSIADVGRPGLRKAYRFALTLGRLLSRCFSRRIDLVYLTLSPTGVAFYRDLLYVALLRLFRMRVVFHLHGKGVRRAARRWLNRLLYRWCFQRAIVILLSPRLYEDVSHFVPRSRCLFVPNAVDDLTHDASTPPARANEGPARILFLSTMMIEKGPIVLLMALSRLRSRGVPFVASFAGPWYRDGGRRHFASVIASRGLDNLVRYLGPRYGLEKESVFAGADIFVLPTYYRAEAFPLVILEAMSHGLPVVSTPEGAIQDLVIHGVNGLLSPQGDHESLAVHLEHLITDPSLRRRMGQAGRRRFLEKYTLDTFGRAMTDALRKALALHNGPQDSADSCGAGCFLHQNSSLS